MSALRWAAVPLVAGVLTGNVAVAAADEPPPAPTPTPTPTATPDPTSTPTPESDATPLPSETGSVVYLTTVTTTTTIVNAPITVVAAPITTTINPTTSPTARLVLNLRGCGGPGGRSPTAPHIERAHVRLARNASLVVRVNGRRVTTLRLPATAQRHARGVALRLRLAPSGMLTIRRPSGRILAVQGCTPA
jgi:hypothetical protein